jgi:two-component system, chemotaxis family, sensor kinase CheA
VGSDENAFGELIQDYIVECLPLAEEVGDTFIQLERGWRDGGAADDDLEAVKGRLHTIKGNSAMMGIVPAQEVAHALEDVCAYLAADPSLRGEAAAELLVSGSGLLIDLIRSAAADSDQEAAAEFVQRVRGYLSSSQSDSRESVPAAAQTGSERRSRERRASNKHLVRVDFHRLDAMLEVLGEGMIEQAAVAECCRRLAGKISETEQLADIDRALVGLEKTLKRLQGILMETRLLPISTVFGRFPRLVRDLAESEKKSVRVVTTGDQIPLDKTILDRVGEPLTHLLTNAVVHGVETPAERVRAGKPEEATLDLRATFESGRVVIRLTDDGRGLDDGRIMSKAKDLGLESRIAEGQQLQSLIFLPGFSTADRVSSLAGRGVGLDVVANAVHELGGSIEVESRPGQGVTFTLNLPLTLSILRSLIVEVDQERYALPMSHVAATVRTEPDTIHEVNRKGIAVWQGDLIHVSDAGALLGTGAAPNGSRRFYIVISMGTRRRGILVDRLIGHQDVVVKSLDPTVGRPELVSGTTIMGDGKVTCILDAARILEHRVSA